MPWNERRIICCICNNKKRSCDNMRPVHRSAKHKFITVLFARRCDSAALQRLRGRQQILYVESFVIYTVDLMIFRSPPSLRHSRFKGHTRGLLHDSFILVPLPYITFSQQADVPISETTLPHIHTGDPHGDVPLRSTIENMC